MPWWGWFRTTRPLPPWPAQGQLVLLQRSPREALPSGPCSLRFPETPHTSRSPRERIQRGALFLLTLQRWLCSPLVGGDAVFCLISAFLGRGPAISLSARGGLGAATRRVNFSGPTALQAPRGPPPLRSAWAAPAARPESCQGVKKKKSLSREDPVLPVVSRAFPEGGGVCCLPVF